MLQNLKEVFIYSLCPVLLINLSIQKYKILMNQARWVPFSQKIVLKTLQQKIAVTCLLLNYFKEA